MGIFTLISPPTSQNFFSLAIHQKLFEIPASFRLASRLRSRCRIIEIPSLEIIEASRKCFFYYLHVFFRAAQPLSDWRWCYPLTDGEVFPSQIPPVFGHITHIDSSIAALIQLYRVHLCDNGLIFSFTISYLIVSD